MQNVRPVTTTHKPIPIRRPDHEVRQVALEVLARQGRMIAMFAVRAALGGELTSGALREARDIVDALIADGAKVGDSPRPAPVPRSFDEVEARIRTANIPPERVDHIVEIARETFEPWPEDEDMWRLSEWKVDCATHRKVRALRAKGVDPRPWLRTLDKRRGLFEVAA